MAGKGTPAIVAAAPAGIAFRVHEIEFDPADLLALTATQRAAGALCA